MTDTLMHRYGADCFGAASFFAKLNPRRLSAAIDTALNKSAEELLFLRWCISGGGLSFSEFRSRIMAPPVKLTAADIHKKIENQTKNVKWRRADGN